MGFRIFDEVELEGQWIGCPACLPLKEQREEIRACHEADEPKSLHDRDGVDLLLDHRADEIGDSSGRLGVKLHGGNGDSRSGATVVHMTINTPNAHSFAQSESQITAQAGRMMSRARRNL